jgi:hypothetical protein
LLRRTLHRISDTPGVGLIMNRQKKTIDIGPLRLSFEEKGRVRSESIMKKIYVVDVIKYELAHRSGWSMLLGYMPFPDCKDVRCLEYSDDTPDPLHRLTHGLRMAIYYNHRTNQEWVELSQARVKNKITPEWSICKKATEQQLYKGSGLNLRNLLTSSGASFGTRVSVLGEKNNRRDYYCAAFPVDDQIVPLVAYAATRVLPILLSY